MGDQVAWETWRHVVAQGTRMLVADIGVELTPQRHINHLNATADTKKWQAIPSSLLHQVYLQSIPQRINVIDAGMWDAAKQDRIDVSPACHQQSLEMRVDLTGLRIRKANRDENWQTARPQNRLNVSFSGRN
jgi:hypothetical protein